MLGCMTARLFYKKFIDLECQDGAAVTTLITYILIKISLYLRIETYKTNLISVIYRSSRARPIISRPTCTSICDYGCTAC